MVTLDALQSHCAWRKPTVAGGVLAQKQPDKFPFVLTRRGGRQMVRLKRQRPPVSMCVTMSRCTAVMDTRSDGA